MIKRIITGFLVLIGCFLSNETQSQNKSNFFGVKTVCIDAGHGGHDPGCHGASANEKDVALAISLKLGKYIEENFPDVKVVYTRKTDVFIELFERASIANKAKADLFICIHANAGGSTAYGTETYVMGLHKSESNLKVAKRENSSILLEEDYKTKYSDFDPNSPESYILLTIRQDAFIDQSLSFAAKIQKQFTERVGRKNRGVKQAGFLVLHQTNMPSVLIETGFLTNKEEEKFLASSKGQDYLSSAIYRAFKEYKNEIEGKDKSKDAKEKEVVNDVIKPKVIVEVKPKTKEILKKERKEKKKNKEAIAIKGVVFKVQFATSSKELELLPQNFKGIENVEIYKAGGLYRYVVGKETNMNAANNLQLQVRNKGYKDAFIIAFSEGKRISISQALKLQQ